MSPLRGRRVLLTRSHEDNQRWAEALSARGILPVVLTCLATEPRPEAAEELARELALCDWLALASRRAAQAAALLLPGGLPKRLRVACVGTATAAEARAVFGRADLVAALGTGAALGAELAAARPRPARVLVAAALEGRRDVEDALEAAGIEARRVAVYRTQPTEPAEERLELGALALDAIFLASPSAVRGLLNQALPPAGVPIVTLGPSTSEAARAAGLSVRAEARTRGLEGLLAALHEHLDPPRKDPR